MQETHTRAARAGWISLAVALVALAGVATAAAALHRQHARRAKPAAVTLRATTLGRILADRRGRTLYVYTVDKPGESRCYGACAKAWPPLLAHGKPVALKGVEKRLLGVTRRRNGARQVTYAKHPLYTFAFDKKAGAVAGQGYRKRWYVLTRTGMVVKRAATAAPKPTPPPATTTTSAGDAWG